MKIAHCSCGAVRGFYHELKCRLCCTFPWQHSSSDECGSESCSEENWEIELRRRTAEEMEKEEQRKWDEAKRIIEEAEFYEAVYEDRDSEENRKVLDNRKKKKLMTR